MKSRLWSCAFWLWLFAVLIGVFGCKGPATPPVETQEAKDGPQSPYMDDVASNKDAQMLKAQGYIHIRLNGWVPFKCSDSDNALFTDAFEADVKSTGAHVTGTICGAFMKGKTIRFN